DLPNQVSRGIRGEAREILVGEPRVVGDVAQERDPRRNGRERLAGATELDLGHDESLEGPAKYVDLPAIDHVPNLLDLPVARHLDELLTALFVDHDLDLVTHEAAAGLDGEQVLAVAGTDADRRLAFGEVSLADLRAPGRRPERVRPFDAAKEATLDLLHENLRSVVEGGFQPAVAVGPDHAVAPTHAAMVRSTMSIPRSPRSISRATAASTRARSWSGASRSRGSRKPCRSRYSWSRSHASRRNRAIRPASSSSMSRAASPPIIRQRSSTRSMNALLIAPDATSAARSTGRPRPIRAGVTAASGARAAAATAAWAQA